jgi:hypothetical protein
MTSMSGTETQALPTQAPSAEAKASIAVQAKTAPEPYMTKAQLKACLRLGSIELVAEVWAITQKQVDVEATRHTRLETKATALLTAIGLSLTIAFTFGATLMSKAAVDFAEHRTWILFSFGCAIITGLISALLALRAVMVTGQRQVEESAIFGDVLQSSDRHKTEDEKEGLMRYRQSLIMHFWEIRNQYDLTYRQKVKFVKWGQRAFAGFLTALLSLCIPIVLAVISKGMTPPPDPKEPMAPPPTRPIDEGHQKDDAYRRDSDDRPAPPPPPPPPPAKK